MYKRLSFAGITTPTGVLPAKYERLLDRHSRTHEGAFDAVTDRLDAAFSIEEREIQFTDPPTAAGDDLSIHRIHRYKALVNPVWIGEEPEAIPGGRNDAVWNVPGHGYTTVAHDEPLSALREAIVERFDSSQVFGVTRLRREGAEMHTDVFTTAHQIDIADGDVYFGISTGHDYTSTTRLYVDVVALYVPDDGSARVLRYLIDPRRRKHTGEAGEDVIEWYGDALDRLETVSDRLYRVIGEAMNYEIDMGEYPCSMAQWFSHLGLPSNAPADLANPAGEATMRLRADELTAWHLYKGGMKAIEESYDSRDTSAYKTHVGTVNTLLFNPSLAEKRVLGSIEGSIVDAREADDEETEPTDVTEYGESDVDDPLETVRERHKTISEGVVDFKTTREQIRALLNDDGTTEAVEEESESDSETPKRTEVDA